MRILLLIPIALSLGGCVVGAVADAAVTAVTLPVKIASAGVDAATTSQAEADQKRGRELRKAEEERGRQWRMLVDRCRGGRPLPTDDCSQVPRY